MTKRNRYSPRAWWQAWRYIRSFESGHYGCPDVLRPMESPLDMAYWQGHVDGYNKCRRETWQGELFEVKYTYE